MQATDFLAAATIIGIVVFSFLWIPLVGIAADTKSKPVAIAIFSGLVLLLAFDLLGIHYLSNGTWP